MPLVAERATPAVALLARRNATLVTSLDIAAWELLSAPRYETSRSGDGEDRPGKLGQPV